MQLTPIVTLILLASPAAALVAADDGVAWSNDASPGGGPVQGIGGSALVLVGSTWSNGSYRSYDNGLHWESIPDFPPVSEARVRFDPSDPSVGYVYGFGGVARTTDAGRTWTHVLHTYVTYRLDVSPSGAVVANYRDGSGTHLYLSTDRGATWTDLNHTLPLSAAMYGLAFGRHDGEVVGMSFGQMWRTHDGGATWQTSNHTFRDIRRAPDGTLWGTGFTVAKSADGAATWESVAAPAAGEILAIGPQGQVYIPTRVGVLRSDDAGATWMDLGSDRAYFGATSGLVDPHAADALFLSNEFIGVAYVTDGAYTTRTTGLPPIDVYALGGTADGSIVLAGGENGIYASRDGGDSWAHTGGGMGNLGISAVAASADGTVLMGGGMTRIFAPFIAHSRDGGRTWDNSEPQLGGDGRIMGIAFDPEDPMRAYAAATMDLSNSKLIETRSGGASWSVVLELPLHEIRDVAWDASIGKPIVATELGVLVYEGSGVVTLRGATGNTWSVAAEGGRSWSSGPTSSLWSSTLGAPHLPWAHTGAYVVDVAPETADVAWATSASGAVHRCSFNDCQDVSPPHQAHAALVRGATAFAATTGGGIYRASI